MKIIIQVIIYNENNTFHENLLTEFLINLKIIFRKLQ